MNESRWIFSYWKGVHEVATEGNRSHLVDRCELVSRVEPHRTRLREESYTVRSTELSEYGSHEIGIIMAYCLLTDMVKES